MNVQYCEYINWKQRGRGQYGGFRTEDQQKFYARMSAVAYGNTPEGRKKEMHKYKFDEKGFKLDNQLGNPDIAVIFNPGTKELILSATGSRFDDKVNRFRDIRSDLGIALGTAGLGKRLKEVSSVVNRALRKYPKYEATLTGHSLGGYLASAISRKTGIPAIVFNRGSSPALEAKDKLARLFRKTKGNVIHYTTNKGSTIDPVSISAKLSGNDTKTISINKTTSDFSHSLSHFGAGKKMTEKGAHWLYERLLKRIVVPIVGNKTTFQNDLKMAGIRLLGNKFKGIFPSDRIPKLNDLKKYAILNLDRSNQPGSHWVAIAFEDGKVYLYDSFGRKGSKIIPSLKVSGNGRVIDSDLDVEQRESETNCGARSLAWLLMFEKFGAKNAILI